MLPPILGTGGIRDGGHNRVSDTLGSFAFDGVLPITLQHRPAPPKRACLLVEIAGPEETATARQTAGCWRRRCVASNPEFCLTALANWLHGARCVALASLASSTTLAPLALAIVDAVAAWLLPPLFWSNYSIMRVFAGSTNEENVVDALELKTPIPGTVDAVRNNLVDIFGADMRSTNRA